MAGRMNEGGAHASVERVEGVHEDVACFFPDTIAPPVALTKELEALHDFLVHQATHIANPRELNELAQMNEKQLESKIRELENLNFRLNLDEAKEIQTGVSMGILYDHASAHAQSPRVQQ
ncbi:hypothetical protein Poli38472_008770 [Pythium oligandrum]|uniref:Uncharacterized protein n=1 Tax=Pythium oligandrum TaxID=41045 RepID=A0A8K1C442_PYTOL|nr:hypothetical protein Poli38472_008770 [Pythium oligandrum]|eukprot:TMW56122.1 hypothetical protein Poli38472_008770 [Pythium oligandrum]